MPDTVATLEHAAPSPDGRHTLTLLQPDAKTLSFCVTDAEGAEVLAPADTWAGRHRTHFLWDDDGRVWVYSSDIGTYVWEESDDGSWSKITWYGSGLTAPAFLQEQVPKRFAPE